MDVVVSEVDIHLAAATQAIKLTMTERYFILNFQGMGLD